MKIYILIFALFLATITYAQEGIFEKQVRKISIAIEEITKQEKDSLKIKVLKIEAKIIAGEITENVANMLKKEAATYHAKNIEEKVSLQENLLQQLVQDKTNGKIAHEKMEITTEEDDNTFSIGNAIFRLNFSEGNQEERDDKRRKRWEHKNKKQRTTTTQFVFALGVNNVLTNNELSSLNRSEYHFWDSHFYELGWTWKTRFSKKPSQLYIKYGFSFLWNNLRLEKNQYHIKNGDFTEIQTYNSDLKDSRLRHVQLNFPVHIEWDLSKSKKNGDIIRDSTHKNIRLGIGGFFGFKLGTRQYLEYKNSEGSDIEEIQYNNFNMNRFNYGLSVYVGYRGVSLYTKYDLNPLFQNTNTRNFSLGVRFDLN